MNPVIFACVHNAVGAHRAQELIFIGDGAPR